MTRLVGTRSNPVLNISTGDDGVEDVEQVGSRHPVPVREETMVQILKELKNNS